MLRFLFMRVLLPVGVTALVVMLASEGVPGLIFGWGLLGYLVWRAWPAIKRDAVAVFGWVPKGRPRLVRPDRSGDL